MDLEHIPGLGPKRIEVLTRAGFADIPSLLRNVPRSWLDRTNLQKISDLHDQSNAVFVGEIIRAGTIFGKRKRFQATVKDTSGELDLVFFSATQYWQKRLTIGTLWVIIGRVQKFRGFQIVHPELQPIESPEGFSGGITPVYSISEMMRASHMEQAFFRKLYGQIFAGPWAKIQDSLPTIVREHFSLLPEIENLKRLHLPKSMTDTFLGRRQLKIMELLPICIRKIERRIKMEKQGVARTIYSNNITQLETLIPFQLTQAQQQAISTILSRMQSASQMHALIQGDVGSGKTMVALFAMVALSNAQSSVQSALMAPTDILARQHFATLNPLLQQLNIRCALLLGATKNAERKQILSDLNEGKIDILIGTHALFSADVAYANLGLVIIDEQHRFGVQQREALLAKGNLPELMVMSATPIPRSLAMTLYGDLEAIIINEKPAGRLPINTRIVQSEKREDLKKWILKECQNHNQAYWIVALVEETEESTQKSVLEIVDELQGFSKQWKIGFVHGRLPSEQRDETLQKFSQGELDILVSTTVIEVGVNVPNANVMVIDAPERFGLAQLHQLRGRIGRGNQQAWCFLCADPQNPAKERLESFSQTLDGFAIAELDLQFRGAGNLEGDEQSGSWILKWFDWIEDKSLIEDVITKSTDLLNELGNSNEEFNKWLQKYQENSLDGSH